MNPFIEKTIPLSRRSFLGYSLKRWSFSRKMMPPILLKFVLSVSLPALAIQAIYNVDLQLNMLSSRFWRCWSWWWCMVWGIWQMCFWRAENATFGSFLIGVMIMNSAYALPFFQAIYGAEGLARASLFDFGNSFMILLSAIIMPLNMA